MIRTTAAADMKDDVPERELVVLLDEEHRRVGVGPWANLVSVAEHTPWLLSPWAVEQVPRLNAL